ncbi:MAG TPA: pirin family protein [Acidimicrobiales bacterium]|nr:pirin family protein [Acidimicrobiales bacterium]
MPAVEAENLLVLPRVRAIDHATKSERRLRSLTTAPKGFEGEGFPVNRAFAGVGAADLDPFIHMDEMGRVDYAPGEPRGTSWHPHRGFETVTYIMDGTFAHRDSTGGGGRITNGDTQWMTAGSGLLHIERPPEELVVSGGLFHGIQLWVNLPARDKWIEPRYQDLRAAAVTLVAGADGASLLRIIAGEVDGHAGPGQSHTPITFVHASVEPGARLEVPWPAERNALVYVLSGSGRVAADGTPIGAGQLALLGSGDYLTVAATGRERLEVLLLGGVPIGEPVAWYGPFVMNTEAELQQAFEDYRKGLLGTVPAGG